MMRDKRNKWLSGVGGVVLIGGLALANYGGGVMPAEAHENHHNPFKQILAKLDLILSKLGTAAPSSSSGGATETYTMRWDTNHPSDSRFTTAFSGAMLDKNTGLVWEQSPAAAPGLTWADARLQCVNKNVGGTRGWRLPSVAELTSLMDPLLPAPYVPGTLFTGVQSATYWSATANAVGSTTAFSVSFQDSFVGTSSKSSTNNVWCVRGLMQESLY